MKLDALVDAVTAEAIDLAWLRAELQPASEAGRRAYERIVPFAAGEESAARDRLERVANLAREVPRASMDALRDALRRAPDPLPPLGRIAMGETPGDPQLLELQRFLDGAARVDALLHAAGIALRHAGPAAREVSEALEPGRSGKHGFYLDGKFDAALAKTRLQAERALSAYDDAHERLAARAAAALGRSGFDSDEFIVMRDDVAVPPVGVRVVREAPTYYLCELELDEPALEALRAREAANQAVAVEEDRVRASLAALVRAHMQPLHALCEALGEFDVLLTQARFAQTYECTVPEIVPGAGLRLTGARYLPLAQALEREGRRYEAISIDLDGAIVLTGPNMGGKSAALRTCAFVAVLASLGIPVPAQSARTELFGAVAWLGIGAHEEAGGLLSSFAREVVRLETVLADAPARMLLLLDEFARTTTPHEGRALLTGVIRVLQRRGHCALAATHLAGIAGATGARHFAVRGLRGVPQEPAGADLSAALTSLADAMDYSVVEVRGGAEPPGDAIALARLLGLDADIVAEAAKALEKGAAWSP